MDQEQIIHGISNATHLMNEAVKRAVDAGFTVELVRTSRCHNGQGYWGDQLSPNIMKEKR